MNQQEFDNMQIKMMDEKYSKEIRLKLSELIRNNASKDIKIEFNCPYGKDFRIETNVGSEIYLSIYPLNQLAIKRLLLENPRHGCGSDILEICHQLAQRLGCSQIMAECCNTDAAISFFLKHEFSLVKNDVFKFYTDNGYRTGNYIKDVI